MVSLLKLTQTPCGIQEQVRDSSSRSGAHVGDEVSGGDRGHGEGVSSGVACVGGACEDE